MIRLGDVRSDDTTAHRQSDDTTAKTRSAIIVEPKRKRSSAFGDAEDMTEEEHRRRGDGADALFRELVRRALTRRDD